MGRASLISCTALTVAMLAHAGGHRSHAAIAAFKRQHPCPATSAQRGKCPGFVIDHVRPLCAGGPDSPENMQWQSISAAKVKDRSERALCLGLHPNP